MKKIEIALSKIAIKPVLDYHKNIDKIYLIRSYASVVDQNDRKEIIKADRTLYTCVFRTKN